MTTARDLKLLGKWLWKTEHAGTYHESQGCRHSRDPHNRMHPVEATQAVISSIESPFSPVRLCKVCFGTDGKVVQPRTVTAESQKVTLAKPAVRSDTSHAIIPHHLRKQAGMAPNRTALTERPQPAQAIAPPPDGQPVPEATWSLDSLPDAIEHTPYSAPVPSGWDAIAGTPEPVRVRAEASLGVNSAAVTEASGQTGKRSRINYRWDLQPVPDPDKGLVFSRALEKYAAGRPSNVTIPHRQEGSPDGRVTARFGVPTQFVKAGEGYVEYRTGMEGVPFWAVRYSVRPFEQRNAGRHKAPQA